jgi:hypothetical protein
MFKHPATRVLMMTAGVNLNEAFDEMPEDLGNPETQPPEGSRAEWSKLWMGSTIPRGFMLTEVSQCQELAPMSLGSVGTPPQCTERKECEGPLATC